MSYDIIKNIKIKDDRVFVKSAPNNVYPRTFYMEECPSLSKILQEQGKEALDLEIFKQFENGNFQRGNNKYTRALHILLNMPEYVHFNWRGGNSKEYETVQENRKKPAYKELLLKALCSRLPKDKFIISKPYHGQSCYSLRVTRRSAKFCYETAKAKLFHFENDCKRLKECFTGAEFWNIEKIN